MRAVTYCRVSTDEQAERHSLGAQEDALTRYAEAMNFTLAGSYVDPGYSGANAERPGLTQLLHHAAEKRFDVVLVYRLDRLARRVQLAYNLIEELSTNGVALKSYAEPMIDTTTPMGKAILGMMAVFAEWERDTFIQRSQLGLRKAIEKGKYSGGIVAYGYAVNEGRLVIQPEEAEVVRLVFRLCTERGWSTIRIAEELTRLGYPTKYQLDGRGVRGKTTSTTWRAGAVLRILKNRSYTGEYLYGKRNGTLAVQEGAQLTRGYAPPIIDDSTFQRAQAQLATNAITSARNAKHTYILKSLVKCRACGRTYLGARTASSFLYSCGGRTVRAATPLASKCLNPNVNGHQLEGHVQTLIRGIIANPTQALADLQRHHEPGHTEAARQAEEELQRALAARQRLTDVYLDPDTRMTKADYLERLSAQDARIQALQDRVSALRDEVRTREARERAAQDLYALSERLAPRVNDLTPEEWQRAAHEVVEVIWVNEDGSTDVHLRF